MAQIYGMLEKAQAENVSADLSNTLLGLFWYNTTDNKMKIYDGAVRAMVTEDGSQTLTNKIFSGGTITGASISGGGISGTDINLGTATDSNKLVVSSNTRANLELLTREAGSIYYSTDEVKYVGDDGLNLIDFGSGGSGGFNYIENGKAEANTDGWVLYANTVAGIRPDNFGGTPAGLTLTRDTAAPLVGEASFKLVKDAANRQGQGAYYQFSNETGHATLKMLLAMLTDSSHANLADGDLAIYLVGSSDSFVADFQVIEPNNPDVLAGVKQVLKQIQFLSGDLDYRLCIHVKSTNASTYDFFFDEVEFGPRSAATGVAITNWKEWIPSTVEGLGTITDSTLEYRQVGSNIEVRGGFRTGTVSAATARLGLPSGLTIGDIKAPNNRAYAGNVIRDGAGTAVRLMAIKDFTSFSFGAGAAQHGDVAGNSLFGSNELVYLRGTIVIKGWSSNTQVSEDFGGRDVVVEGAGNGGGTLVADTTDIDWIETRDTSASWNGSQFTAPETGDYSIEGYVHATTAITVNIRAFVDGVLDKSMGGNPAPGTTTKISGKIYLEKGQVLSFRPQSAFTLNNTTTFHHIYINKAASSQQILGAEKVFARYTTDSGQSIPSSVNTTVVFEDLDEDTHAIYNNSTGVGTIKASGTYSFSPRICILGRSTNTGRVFGLIQFAGSRSDGIVFDVEEGDFTGYDLWALNGTVEVTLQKGDTFQLEVNQDTGVSKSLLNSGSNNYLQIKRIK